MPAAVSLSRPLPSSVQEVIANFRRLRELDVRLWVLADHAWQLADAGDCDAVSPPADHAVVVGEGDYRVEVLSDDPAQAAAESRLLAAMLETVLGLYNEIWGMADELAQRFEEITLLYSISETLGSVISVKDAAGIILSEVIETISAGRAALWVYDPTRGMLDLAAEVGMQGQSGPIRIDDPTSVTAEVFRTQREVVMNPDDVFPRGELDRGTTQRGYFLSVPVSYTPPEGQPRTVGVINLTGRGSNKPYSAADVNLVSAIASQVGAAVENGRLVAESLRRERLVREMELAHDLQLKLLPSTEQFAGAAEVVARCIPADSVGGDFYHLFQLSGNRFGVMIGDVSTHGFGAALIMALTMSAVAIHASEGDPPAQVLRRVHQALIEELETTEMYLTLFYGVIDPEKGEIVYANAGHHHAFRIDDRGNVERLGATSVPFGMSDLDSYVEATAAWHPGRDLLFLFTDGLSDALEIGEVQGEQVVLDMVAAGRNRPLQEVLEDLFAASDPGSLLGAGDDRTAVLVRK
jgi:phosphoserine phosphatase RsbU/P